MLSAIVFFSWLCDEGGDKWSSEFLALSFKNKCKELFKNKSVPSLVTTALFGSQTLQIFVEKKGKIVLIMACW